MSKPRSEMTAEELAEARELGRLWQANRRKRLKEEAAAAEAEKKEAEKKEAAEPEQAEPEIQATEKTGSLSEGTNEKLTEEKIEYQQTAPVHKLESVGECLTGVPFFICTACGSQIEGGADTCPKCGVIADWRGVPFFEDSEEFLVCEECGAVMTVKHFVRLGNRCKRCGHEY